MSDLDGMVPTLGASNRLWMSPPRSAGCEQILAERIRQIDAEGWTEAHDDAHTGGELLLAAWAYLTESDVFGGEPCGDEPPEGWPWAADWWRPSPDLEKNLVRAGALIAAELDRLERRRTLDAAITLDMLADLAFRQERSL